MINLAYGLIGAEKTNGKVNHLGRAFVNGRPLPVPMRYRIIELYQRGLRICDISREIRVSHGCVSKILARFMKDGVVIAGVIGGSSPRLTIPKVVARIREIKKMNPRFYAWQIRDQLMGEDTCNKTTVPSVSSIHRVLRRKVDSSYNTAEKSGSSELAEQCSRHYSSSNSTLNFATSDLYPCYPRRCNSSKTRFGLLLYQINIFVVVR